MLRVEVPCANLFHEEVEGGDSTVMITIARAVASRAELDALLDAGVDLHGRCYCGHVTQVTGANALLREDDADSAG